MESTFLQVLDLDSCSETLSR